MGRKLTDTERRARAAEAEYRKALSMSTWVGSSASVDVDRLKARAEKLRAEANAEAELSKVAREVGVPKPKPVGPSKRDRVKAGAKATASGARKGWQAKPTRRVRKGRVGQSVRRSVTGKPSEQLASTITTAGDLFWSSVAFVIALSVLYLALRNPKPVAGLVTFTTDRISNFIDPFN